MIFLTQEKKGFTLIELIIVISVITVLSTIVLAAMSQGRVKARDTQRISDLAQIQLALRVYKDSNGAYPVFDEGISIGKGSLFDIKMKDFFPVIPSDPLGSFATTYEYFYGSDVHCKALDNSKRYIVILARTMEKSSSANWATICGSDTPFKNGSATNDTYGIVLGIKK